jgi:ADP-ribose pyrophosphatase
MAQGRFLRLENLRYEDRRGVIRHWETTFRQNDQNAAVVIGILRPSNRLLLVRQFRPPLNAFAVEFPAGLVNAGEEPAQTAIRELKEETGYTGTVDYCSPKVFTSPGLSSEFVHLVKMTVDLENQPDLATHFDESEYIETFLVAQDELPGFIRQAETDGFGVDTKMYMWAISRGGFDV